MPYIRTGDVMTYHEVHGEGLPIIFIHGGWTDHNTWKPQIEHFSRSYRAVVYDLRGHEKTAGPKVKEYSLELFVNDLKTLFEGLSIEEPILCGRSLVRTSGNDHVQSAVLHRSHYL